MKPSLKVWLITFLGLGLLAISTAIIYHFTNTPPPNPQKQLSQNPSVVINNQEIFVEVADTPEKQRQGLAGHEPLSDTQGMLFPYNPPQKVTFWMKGMTFPIDIIYIANNQVVQIYSQVPPPEPDMAASNLPRYPANQPIDYVLETPSGWTKNHQISVGEPVRFKI